MTRGGRQTLRSSGVREDVFHGRGSRESVGIVEVGQRSGRIHGKVEERIRQSELVERRIRRCCWMDKDHGSAALQLIEQGREAPITPEEAREDVMMNVDGEHGGATAYHESLEDHGTC